MIDKVNSILMVLFLSFLFNIQLMAQSIDQLYEEANAKFQSTFNPHYELSAFIVVDSSHGKSPGDILFHRYKIEDTYKTLAHCAVFAGSGIYRFEDDLASPGFIGVYKNGSFVWYSDTLINCNLIGSPSVLATTDLNNDGKTDIIVAWHGGNQNQIQYLWIVSWDGQTGTFINDMKPGYKSGYESVVVGFSGSFEFADINNDGIKEIVSNWYTNGPESEQKFVYRWDGSSYGKHGSIDLPSGNITIPHNQLTVAIKAKVTKLGSNYYYQYTLINSPTSTQDIEGFFIESRTDTVQSINSPDRWNYFGIRESLINWQVPPIMEGAILHGISDSNFSYSTQSLPFVSTSFIRGRINTLLIENITTEDFYRDVRNNSFIAKTIGPSDPPDPFIPLNFLDTLTSYTTQFRSLGWVKDQTTSNKYLNYFASAKSSLGQNNIASTRATLNQVLQDVNTDSASLLTSEAYALLRFNAEYLLAQLPTAPISGCNVKLVNSTGTKLTGGALQYYDGNWKDAVNNNDGTFFVPKGAGNTTLSLRMTYGYGTQTKSNVTIGSDTVVFQTINTQIHLQNSSGVLIDTGTVQYYAGAWRNLGTTTNGIATKELLPANYSFRMTYAYASKDKQQDIGTNATVVFQTVNAAILLQNSQGVLMPAPSGDQGTVQYYSGAWRNIGTTLNGVATKELLPNNYSFRITYAYASKDKQQDIGTNAMVVFQTVNTAVQLQNSQGSLMPAPSGDQGTVQYYSGAWRSLGTTTNGIINKELLPNNYSFRITYAYASKDKQQDIGTNATVVFQTVNAAVQLKNSLGNLMPAPSGDQGTVQYYSGAWRSLGTTTNGTVSKELLPNNYSFRMTYEYVSIDKSQDLSTNSTVSFSTVLCTVRVRNMVGQVVNDALASYYSGAWRQIGNTVNGEVTKELLPVNLSFRVKYGTQQQDKQQNLSTNTVVEFAIP